MKIPEALVNGECTKSGKQCNPARVEFCLCWWESSSPEDFNRIFRERNRRDEK